MHSEPTCKKARNRGIDTFGANLALTVQGAADNVSTAPSVLRSCPTLQLPWRSLQPDFSLSEWIFQKILTVR